MGLPMKVMGFVFEALLANLTCIVFDVGGIKETQSTAFDTSCYYLRYRDYESMRKILKRIVL